jgi:hypothetical protein
MTSLFRRALPALHRDREPSLVAWIDGGYDLEAVSRVLTMLTLCFRWPEGEASRLRPGDRVWALYHSYYPQRAGWRKWVGMSADELEMETLLRDLQHAVPADVSVQLRSGVTVGDLVELLGGAGRRYERG